MERQISREREGGAGERKVQRGREGDEEGAREREQNEGVGWERRGRRRADLPLALGWWDVMNAIRGI